MADTDRDYEGAVDALQADMARHQREIAGVPVTADANRKLAAETIQRLEREHAEQKPAPAPAVNQHALVHTVERRELNGHIYTLDKSPTPERPFRSATEFEAQVLRHAMPRIEHLMTLLDEGPLGTPSWRTRTMAAMYFKVKSLEARQSGRFDLADNYERAFQLDLYELLEDSNKSLGDWRKTPAPAQVAG